MSEIKSPNPIDVHVGARMKLRRNMLRMSQERLGDALGITFQQIQKYEKGTNRIGASRLQHIATILRVRPGYFFEDAPETPEIAGSSTAPDTQVMLAEPMAFDLLKAFVSLPLDARRSILEVTNTVAAARGGTQPEVAA